MLKVRCTVARTFHNLQGYCLVVESKENPLAIIPLLEIKFIQEKSSFWEYVIYPHMYSGLQEAEIHSYSQLRVVKVNTGL